MVGLIAIKPRTKRTKTQRQLSVSCTSKAKRISNSFIP
jgi:hypothetical protein